MRALGVVKADTCAGCGGDLSQTTLKVNDGRYIQPPPIVCHSCETQDATQKTWQKGFDDKESPRPVPGGRYWPSPVLKT